MKALAKFKRVAITACAVAAGLFAHAATEKTSYYAWDETKQAVVEQAPVDAAVLGDINEETVLSDGWYVVKGELFVTEVNIIVGPAATVNLILADDAEFNLSDSSLIVNTGSTLNIYGQAKNTGKLIVDRYQDGDAPQESYDAAIGGAEEKSNGAINIHGGVIKAKGWYGAGIGAGGADGEYDLPDQEGIITFYGGVVRAYSYKGAGIGGGSHTDGNDDGGYGNGGEVRTYGGVVSAMSSGNAPGIGGGVAGNGGDFYADGACIAAHANATWPLKLPGPVAHGIGGGFNAENQGSIAVDRSIGYNIYTSWKSDSLLDTISAGDLEDAAENNDLTDGIYYFSTSHKITLKKLAPHVASIKWSYVQQDGSEGSEHDLQGDHNITVQSYLPFGSDEFVDGGHLIMQTVVSNGVKVVYTCEDGYTFQDGKKTAEVWIHPTRVRGDLKLEVGGDERAPYVIPAPVPEKSYYKLSMPDVDDATWTVTTNGVKVADLAKILKGTTVTVTWTAREGYVITSGETETFTMTADYEAKAPTVVRAPQTYSLSIPPVANASATVTTNGVKVADLAKIAKGAEVTVTWTAYPGYVITSGATETFTMTADRWATPPVVEKATEFWLYPNGDVGKFSPAEKGKKTFLGAIVSTNGGEVAGSITVTLKAPNKKGLFDVSATVKTLTGKKSYSFKMNKIEVPTNDAPYTVHMELNKKSEHHELDVVFDGDSVTGTFDSKYKVDAALDVFAIKGHTKQEALTPFIATWAGALESTGSNEIYSVSAKVAKNGKTKVTVMMPDGKKANCSAKAVIGANGVVAVPVTLWTKVNKQKATIGFWLTFQKTGEATICAVQRLSAVRDQATQEEKVGLKFSSGDAAVLSVTSKEFKESFKPVFDSAAGKARGEITKNGLKLASNGFITGSLTWGSGKTKVTGKAYGVMVGRKGVATLKLKDGTTDIFMVEEPAK